MSELPGIGFSKEEVWSASVVSSIVYVCVYLLGETMGIRVDRGGSQVPIVGIK
jgi:hypothetical protein